MVFFLLALPVSTNYQLKDFGIGSGGGSGASTNYGITGISGEQSAGKLDGTNYDLGAGMVFTNQANVPSAPTLTNPSNYYNKLLVTLVPLENPTDATYVIAISSDNFVTTEYVQSDDTVGATLGIEDYQTYTNWGGVSGTLIIGLLPNTTYKVKVKAMQGAKTETDYGPVATQATVGATLSFDIDVSSIDEENSIATTGFGDLTAGTVTDSQQKIWVNFETNAENGGRVYIRGENSGLESLIASYTINSINGNLASAQEGFGAQESTSTNGLSAASFYDQAGDTVGMVDGTIREMFTATAPTASGRGSFLLKAKSSSVTPAAGDYQDVLTIITSASF